MPSRVADRARGLAELGRTQPLLSATPRGAHAKSRVACTAISPSLPPLSAFARFSVRPVAAGGGKMGVQYCHGPKPGPTKRRRARP